jgi:hypothetical protein
MQFSNFLLDSIRNSRKHAASTSTNSK